MILKTEADKKAEVSGQKYTHFFLQTTSIMAHTVRGLLPCRLESFVVTMVGSLAEKKPITTILREHWKTQQL